MSSIRWVLGSMLPRQLQEHVKGLFMYRCTRDHAPVLVGGRSGELQFDSDEDWLAHTKFAVSVNGTKLDGRVNSCCSSPTWPDRDPLIREMHQARKKARKR